MDTLRTFFFLGGLILPLSGSAHTIGCTFTVQDLDLGTYTSNQSHYLDTAGSLSISNCESAFAIFYTIKLSEGTSGSAMNRVLKSDLDSLNYNLYKDPSRHKIWGDAEDMIITASMLMGQDGKICGVKGQQACQHTVYGRIPGNQNISSGIYKDNIIVTLEY